MSQTTQKRETVRDILRDDHAKAAAAADPIAYVQEWVRINHEGGETTTRIIAEEAIKLYHRAMQRIKSLENYIKSLSAGEEEEELENDEIMIEVDNRMEVVH